MRFEINLLKMEELYNDTLAKFRMPPQIVATKEFPDGPICHGNLASIYHNHWSSRQSFGRGDTKLVWFDFDNVIDLSGVRLTAAHRRLDYTTKKLFVLTGLGAAGDKPNSLDLVLQRARQYDLFVRWRLSRGVEHNANLTPRHFEMFCDDVSGDPLSFIPVMERLDGLFLEIACGNVDINDLYKEDAKNHRQYFDWPRLGSGPIDLEKWL